TLLAIPARIVTGPQIVIGNVAEKILQGRLVDQPNLRFALSAIDRLAAACNVRSAEQNSHSAKACRARSTPYRCSARRQTTLPAFNSPYGTRCWKCCACEFNRKRDTKKRPSETGARNSTPVAIFCTRRPNETSEICEMPRYRAVLSCLHM